MSDGGEEEFKFYADKAKTGRAGCKKCKQKIDSGTLRMAKVAPSPFGSGLMKVWHHIPCMFQVFAKQRKSTAKIECLDDIGGWDSLSKEDQEEILSYLPESAKVRKEKTEDKSNQQEDEASDDETRVEDNGEIETEVSSSASSGSNKKDKMIKKPTAASAFSSNRFCANHKDNSLREFRRLCSDIANIPAYTEKTSIINRFITKGTDGEGFKGDLLLTVKLLLPGVIKRIYNLQSKQIVKIMSRVLNADQDAMLESLEEGDVAETVRIFFESSTKVKPSAKSTLSLQQLDEFLETLSKMTREEDQIGHFTSILPLCTSNDLKIIIRLIKHDLRIYAGAKHVLDAVHPDAYEAFQTSRDINSIIAMVTSGSSDEKSKKKAINIGEKDQSGKAKVSIAVKLLTPILPMLAQPCKSSEEALKKCPNGMYADIKYDGERVQVHKSGTTFKYFSRSLKPVVQHKVKSLEEFIPKAFKYGRDLILDCEILLMDTITSKPLPFGTLGKHKKTEFQDATVCLFVFDCIYYNGESLLHKPLKERRQILEDNMNEIPHRVVFSDMKKIDNKKDLEMLMVKVFKDGLEGLVLKDVMSVYEPGKRHWLKVKKDYLFGGSMADMADLVVLGAWYGTGKKGGMLSVFLMGCYDEINHHWCTVTKVHTGHDDATLERLQKELKMVKISKDMSKLPSWLRCTKTMVPDFVCKDPKESPVWEITGAELTKHVIHTAGGISVRFPRVTRIRHDKDWKTATNLSELKELYRKSKETSDFSLPGYSEEETSQAVTIPKKTFKKQTKANNQEKESSESPEKSPSKVSTYNLRNPLPDVFSGMKLYIPKDHKLSSYAIQVIPRYFTAYGGEILDSENSKEATHHIVNDKVKESSVKDKFQSTPITSSWLLSCISSQVLQPIPCLR